MLCGVDGAGAGPCCVYCILVTFNVNRGKPERKIVCVIRNQNT